jgi:cytochrome c-type biogenesis protein CcmF
MNVALGDVGVLVAFVASLFGIITIGYGLYDDRPAVRRTARWYAFFVLGGVVLAFAAMERALITRDFTVEYVAQVGSSKTPALYNVAALWSSLEGSILLWATVLAGFLVATVVKFRDRLGDQLVGWALLTIFSVSLFFTFLMLRAADPFVAFDPPAGYDGPGPNPLLQNHPLMVIHPPMLYLGYVGFTVPFSFAIASLVTGRFGEGWLSETRRATLVAWGFLTVGIVLGAWWSYEVLGWGGYWAWDPVENASLLPWLTATAFIHSVMVQERRGMLRVWNLSLVIATFCLTILGTFLTRSGILNSVHSFTQSAIGPTLLVFLGIVAATGIGLIAWRGDRLRAPGRIDSAVSRESAFLANNLLFAALAFVVLLGTVYPLIAEALQDKQLSVGEPYFDRMTTPLGIALLFLMAAAPALPWRRTSGDVLRDRLLVPAWAGALTMVVAVALGARELAQVLAFGLGAFAVAGIVRQYVIGARGRRRATGEAWPLAFVRMVRGNPRLYGGLVVHVGVVIAAVAIASSSAYSTKREVRLAEGKSATVRGYTLTYTGSHSERSGQKNTVSADIRVHRGGDDLGTYAPAISTFPNASQGIGTPSVRTGFREDVYLTLVSSPNEQGRVTVGVAVNPMVLWLWVGGGVMAFGALVALSPSLRRRPRPVPEHVPVEPPALEPEKVPV